MSVRAVIVPGSGANYGSLREACRRVGVDAEISDDRARIIAATHVLLPGVGAAGHAMRNLRDRGLDRVLREITQPLLGICLGMQLLLESSEESLEAPELARRRDLDEAAVAPCPPTVSSLEERTGVKGRSGTFDTIAVCSAPLEANRLRQQPEIAALSPCEGLPAHPTLSPNDEAVGGEGLKRRAPVLPTDLKSSGLRFPSRETHCLGLLPSRVLRLPAAPSWPHMGWNRMIVDQPTHPLLAGIGAEDWFYFVHGYAAPVSAQTIAHCDHGQSFAAIVAHGNVHGVQFHPEKSAVAGRRLLANFFALT
jgi:imidazoleglycerol phosphate synthase glutamine amidotransferase subunit HisH